MLRSGIIKFSKLVQPLASKRLLKSGVTASELSLQQPTALRLLHTSFNRLGLEEFFDDPKNFGEDKIKSGAAWSKDLLRKKSAVELHQLWFILLKERNMLMTQENYCLDNDQPIPGPDRLDKVAESMGNLRDVIDERQQAKNMLLYGRTTKEPQEKRKSALGAVYTYTYKEHLIPKELQLNQRHDKSPEVASFHPKIEEMQLRMKEKASKNRMRLNYLIRKQYNQMRRANPSLPDTYPEWFKNRHRCQWKYGIHPKTYVFLKKERGFDSRKFFTRNPKATKDRV